MKSKLYVKDICKNKGITLKKLAEQMGVTPSSLSQVITCDNPGVATLEKIAEVLGVSFQDLFVMPSESLLDSRFFDFRNTLAKEIYMRMFDMHWDDQDADDDKLMRIAIVKANRLSNAIIASNLDDKYADENFKFAVFEYCNDNPISFIGVFNTYDGALNAALKFSEPFLRDTGDEYTLCNINTEYCTENLENPEDVIFCDGRPLFKLKPTDAGEDSEVYSYVVRTLFLDEPLIVPDLDGCSPEEDAMSASVTSQKLAK